MKFLKVPYAEKDEAKALGARWNQDRKAWYVPDGVADAPFARWITAGQEVPAIKEKAAKVDTYSGKPVSGKQYFEMEHDCSPFGVCAQCAPLLSKAGWSEANDAVRRMLAALPAR
jgi:hypothetical protein